MTTTCKNPVRRYHYYTLATHESALIIASVRSQTRIFYGGKLYAFIRIVSHFLPHSETRGVYVALDRQPTLTTDFVGGKYLIKYFEKKYFR